jgi:signal transduction histidine kinase
LNLIVNAAQSMTEDQKGTLSVRSGLSEDNSHVWVEVQDTGSGISPENLSKIFDPFYTTKAIGQGTGLGLSVSHGIIQHHAGALEVQSTLGVGTCFKVILPIVQVQACPETLSTQANVTLLS